MIILNEKIFERVIGILRLDSRIDDKNITISIKENGIVVLGGTVSSYTEKHLCESIVGNIFDVKGVANELKVDLTSSYKRSDVDIVKSALKHLEWRTFVPEENIKVSVSGGRLTLEGIVKHYFEKEEAEKAVQDLCGVICVINNIKIKSGIKPINVKEMIKEEFQRNARLDANNINVYVDGNNITLEGKVMYYHEKSEARKVAWSIPGVENVYDNIIVL